MTRISAPRPPVRAPGAPAATLALAALGALACGDARSDAAAAEDAAPAARGATLPTDTVMRVQGTDLFVHMEGSGEPLLVVHGGPLLDHGYLARSLEGLGDDYRLVFYDQRLSGRSAGVVDSASVTLDQFVADIEGIRTGLGLDAVHLLGHSWGGLIAMKYALAHPDRLRSLVLVSPLPPSTDLWQAEQRAQTAALEPADTAGMGAVRASPGMASGDPKVIERLLQLSFRSQLHDAGLADSLRFDIPADYGERSRQFGFMMADLQSYDIVAGLARLDVPTLVVYGGSETGAASTADTLLATIPDVRTERIPDAGHFAFLERPAAFREVLTRFLRAPGR